MTLILGSVILGFFMLPPQSEAASVTGEYSEGSSVCSGSILGHLGADVSSFYRNVQIRIGPNGVPIVPVGSKAFIYWRDRTPIQIPDSAFVFQFMPEKDVRNSVAKQIRSSGLYSSLDARLYDGDELHSQWALLMATAPTDLPVETKTSRYLFLEGVDAPTVVFSLGEIPHAISQAKVLGAYNGFLDRFPKARILFSGELMATMNSSPEGGYQIETLILTWAGWIEEDFGSLLKGEVALRRMLDVLHESIPLAETTQIIVFGGGWNKAMVESYRKARQSPQ